MGDFEADSSNDSHFLICKWETSDVDSVLGIKEWSYFVTEKSAP
jgi:hypothetical protein